MAEERAGGGSEMPKFLSEHPGAAKNPYHARIGGLEGLLRDLLLPAVLAAQ
jgi:hypothetical protein